ncbi:MAG TPA: response regulator transcription factor [Candidatus Limnocylindria bacterium]
MIRVLIVDDHKLVRQGLRFLLAQERDFEIVGECADGQAAIDAATRLAPDVVLLDLLMPDLDGVSALPRILAARPSARVVVLTSDQDDERIIAAIRAGAISYLLKTAGVEEVVGAVRAAAAGESRLAPSVAARLMNEVRRDREPADPLSGRERQVLVLIARGRANKEIGLELGITEETVKTHVASVLAKLHLADRRQAAIYALQHRLVPLDTALRTEPDR